MTSLQQNKLIVSFDDEPLILVDADDNVLGHASKSQCHDGQGLLHRAFSVFLFDAQNRLLLQKRSAQKRLWPLYWSNTCCSHPRRGEAMDAAAQRRTQEELAVCGALKFTYSFIYQASFGVAGAEHEFCSVYVGRLSGPVRVNDNEVAETRYIAATALDDALAANPTDYTPWLHLEWPRIRRDHWETVQAL